MLQNFQNKGKQALRIYKIGLLHYVSLCTTKFYFSTFNFVLFKSLVQRQSLLYYSISSHYDSKFYTLSFITAAINAAIYKLTTIFYTFLIKIPAAWNYLLTFITYFRFWISIRVDKDIDIVGYPKPLYAILTNLFCFTSLSTH